MASSYKTSYLNLNKFIGTDKPKMEDFNHDNQKIDNAVKNHMEDSRVHVSLAEKELWNGGAFIMGTYVGDDYSPREINIGFRPRLCIIYQVGMPLINYDSQSGINVRSAIITEDGCTQYAHLEDNGFMVESVNSTAPFGSSPRLNLKGEKYVYVAYK